jgi:hypothetical protein
MPGRASKTKATSDADLLRHMRERLDYDPKEGAFYRKAGFRGVEAGFRLGTLDGGGKRQTTFLGKRYQVDHLVWLWETGALPTATISHVNGNNQDDRFGNLSESRKVSVANESRRAASFVAKARAKFGDALDLSQVRYVNGQTRVTIACGKHGSFERKPENCLASTHGCPTCCREHAMALLKKSPEAKAATRKAYIQAHRDLYRAANRRSLEKLRVTNPSEYEKRLKVMRERSNAWMRTDRGRAVGRAQRHRRRARLKDACSPGVTTQEWNDICARYTGPDGLVRCAYCKRSCGAKPTVEHVVPITRGGRDKASNVVPACGSCNSSKCNKLLTEWQRAAELLTPEEIQLLMVGARRELQLDDMSYSESGGSSGRRGPTERFILETAPLSENFDRRPELTAGCPPAPVNR